MTNQTTPTPEGWRQEGPCFIRVHDGHFAVMDESVDLKGWRVLVNYRSGGRDASDWKPMCEALDWAHAKLGVPKPVHVHDQEFVDGSRVFFDDEKKRSAHVQPLCQSWRCQYADKEFISRDYWQVCDKAREYVRGVQ